MYLYRSFQTIRRLLQCVPRKVFESVRSADSDTSYTIYISHCKQKAVPKFPNPFGGTQCISHFFSI